MPNGENVSALILLDSCLKHGLALFRWPDILRAMADRQHKCKQICKS